MKHADALRIAQELVERLRPACTRIEIAGSVRRGKPDVKDIEIVAVPDLTFPPVDRPVFGQPAPKIYATKLDKLLAQFHDEGWLKREKIGPKYKKVLIDPQKFGIELGGDSMFGGISLDLFLVTPPAEWGVLMAIRTGPADFSHWCVTRQRNGGVMPNTHRCQDGAVWLGATEEKHPDPSTKLSMSEEIDFLKFLGLEWIEPGEREARWMK